MSNEEMTINGLLNSMFPSPSTDSYIFKHNLQFSNFFTFSRQAIDIKNLLKISFKSVFLSHGCKNECLQRM